MNLYEILVPTIHPDGRPIKTRFHKVWDQKVRSITNGLTIMSPVKGQWVSGNELFNERMIPVRIACTENQIEDIINLTMIYYAQKAVMVYKISDEVIIRHAE